MSKFHFGRLRWNRLTFVSFYRPNKKQKNTDLIHILVRCVIAFTLSFILGLLSLTMRELTSLMHDGPKWIVLDGDIDPKWIESLNTVMDDNKVKTGLWSLSVCARSLPLSSYLYSYFFFRRLFIFIFLSCFGNLERRVKN